MGFGTSGTTGILASGELCKGCNAGKPKPWAEGGDGLEDVGEALGTGNELPSGGETYLSEIWGGVVVPDSLPLPLLDTVRL